MRVLVTGSRDWDDWELIHKEFLKLPKDTVIGHGDAEGLDRMAHVVATELGFEVKRYPANWNPTDAKRSGLYRNTQMLWDFNPDLCLAFRSKPNSRGTNDMIYKCKMKRVDITIVDKW